jgi:O-antigen ligase
MRRTARILLLIYAFTIPWEYSLDLGAPFGNIARIVGLLLLMVAIPAVLQAGKMRTPNALEWLALAMYLWFACTCFWTVDTVTAAAKMRGYAQEMMVVWFLWEFAEDRHELRAILRMWLAGSWVLAALTIVDLSSAAAMAAGQIRFAAIGQDPNDVARFLDLGFPVAALLLDWEPHRPGRALAIGYFPLGVAAVLLTASRGGFFAVVVAMIGCAIVLHRNHFRIVLLGFVALPIVAAALWFLAPHETLGRLATIADQLQSGDLNQRWNIWEAGWHAFVGAPFLGHGVGSFVSAAGLAPIDTAHNTALSILVEAGICGFSLVFAIVAMSIHSVLQMRGTLQTALLTLVSVWIISALVGTVIESRTTWLMFGVIAVAARLTVHPMTRFVTTSASTNELLDDAAVVHAR